MDNIEKLHTIRDKCTNQPIFTAFFVGKLARTVDSETWDKALDWATGLSVMKGDDDGNA